MHGMILSVPERKVNDMKTYDLGTIGDRSWKASINRTSSGYFEVCVNDGKNVYNTIHSTEVEALREILSYCETDEEL